MGGQNRVNTQVELLEALAEVESLRQAEHQKVQERDAQLQAISRLLKLLALPSAPYKEFYLGVLETIADIFHTSQVILKRSNEEGVNLEAHHYPERHGGVPSGQCRLSTKGRIGKCITIPDSMAICQRTNKQCDRLRFARSTVLIAQGQLTGGSFVLMLERPFDQTFTKSESGQLQSLIPIIQQGILLHHERQEKEKILTDLRDAQKMDAIGRLAGGIAHEINTPAQYVGDNLHFIQETYQDLSALLQRYGALADKINQGEALQAEIHDIATLKKTMDFDFACEEFPLAVEQALSGVQQVAHIVSAMKEFSHPSTKDRTAVDLNKVLNNAIIISKNEWKHVADLETHFQANLPLVPCLVAELNQVILNVIINAAHAIEATRKHGLITISTEVQEEWAIIKIRDNGAGIKPDHLEKIFTPFFTTKEVGKGTGQGLSIAWDIIVNKHQGYITCESTYGEGATFIIGLPKG